MTNFERFLICTHKERFMSDQEAKIPSAFDTWKTELDPDDWISLGNEFSEDALRDFHNNN